MSCAAAVVAADGSCLLLLLLRRRLSAGSVHLSNSCSLLTRYQSSATAAAAAASSSFRPLDAAKLINCKLISTRRRVRRRHIPWLIVSSPSKPESRYLYDIIQQSITREIHLPHIAYHRFIGSSQGFLFSLNSRAEIHATNPLTGAHLPLPPTSSLPNVAGVVFDNDKKISGYVVCVNKWSNPPQFDHWDAETKMRYKYYSKAIFSPSLHTAVVIHGDSGRLAFCRPTSSSSSSSSSWIALHAPIDCFHDIVFHKDQLHAINVDGTVAIFDDDHLNCNDPARRPPTLSPRQRVVESNGHHYRMSLVESPNGEELFLVC